MENGQKQVKIEDLKDLELADASGILYQQLMQIQQQLISINTEIQKRKKEIVKDQ
jgi:hypothetical protein